MTKLKDMKRTQDISSGCSGADFNPYNPFTTENVPSEEIHRHKIISHNLSFKSLLNNIAELKDHFL